MVLVKMLKCQKGRKTVRGLRWKLLSPCQMMDISIRLYTECRRYCGKIRCPRNDEQEAKELATCCSVGIDVKGGYFVGYGTGQPVQLIDE